MAMAKKKAPFNFGNLLRQQVSLFNVSEALLLSKLMIRILLTREPLNLGKEHSFNNYGDVLRYIKGQVTKFHPYYDKRLEKAELYKGESARRFLSYSNLCSEFVGNFTEKTDSKFPELVVKSGKYALLALIFSTLIMDEFLLNNEREDPYFTAENLFFSDIRALFYLSFGLVYKDFLATGTKAELDTLKENFEKRKKGSKKGGENSRLNFGQPKIQEAVRYLNEFGWHGYNINAPAYKNWRKQNGYFPDFGIKALRGHLNYCWEHEKELRIKS